MLINKIIIFIYIYIVGRSHKSNTHMEAKWYNKGYIPSLEEYLSNGWMTSGCLVLGVLSFFSIMNEVSHEMEHFLENNHQQILHDPCLILRLLNDLSTHKVTSLLIVVELLGRHVKSKKLIKIRRSFNFQGRVNHPLGFNNSFFSF